MAQKKGGGSTRNGRDSKPKRLGVKVYGGQTIIGRLHHRSPARHARSTLVPTWASARTTRCSR